MALKYNTETAVERDIKTQNQADYTYFSNNNIEQQSQNQIFTSVLSLNTSGTDSETLTESIILTEVNINISGYASSHNSSRLDVYIGAEIIRSMVVQFNLNEEPINVIEKINLPNIVVDAETILKIVITEQPNILGYYNVSFIGYF